MRLFIAVPLAVPVREQIGALVAGLKKSGADCKWVEPENLHVTMAFLGDVEEDKLPVIEKALAEATAGRNKFPVSFGGTGTFDNRNGPRIVWVGMSEGSKELVALGEALLSALRKAGFKVEERGFHPHVTLGRLRSQSNILKLNALLRQPPVPSPVCDAERLQVVHSKLSDKGPTYTVIRERALG